MSMGNGEEYIWKPAEESSFPFVRGPSLENGHNNASNTEVISTHGCLYCMTLTASCCYCWLYLLKVQYWTRIKITFCHICRSHYIQTGSAWDRYSVKNHVALTPPSAPNAICKIRPCLNQNNQSNPVRQSDRVSIIAHAHSVGSRPSLCMLSLSQAKYLWKDSKAMSYFCMTGN